MPPPWGSPLPVAGPPIGFSFRPSEGPPQRVCVLSWDLYCDCAAAQPSLRLILLPSPLVHIPETAPYHPLHAILRLSRVCSSGNCLKPALSRMYSEAQTQSGLRLVPFPGLNSSGDQVFGNRSCWDLLPPLSLTLGFLGVQLAHLLRRILTIQNPKKSVSKETCLQFGR